VFGENTFVCDYARRHNTRVFLVSDSAQVELFDTARIKAGSNPVRNGRVPGCVRIGWVGSVTTSGALEKLREPLLRLCARRPEVELRVLGARPADAARLLAGIPHSVVTEYDGEAMVREMLAMDIGIFPAPLDREDYRARGPLKALLYMAAGLPVVCQQGGECSVIIEDGVSGMLADGDGEWERKLDALLADPELRRRMGAAALDRVRRGYSLAQTYATLRDALLAVMADEGILRTRPAPAGHLRWRARTRDGFQELILAVRAVLRRLKGRLA
jgi:glycosyltransferase involved in cell wall biosynthesis